MSAIDWGAIFPSLVGPTGPQGPTGPIGPTGPQGPTGPAAQSIITAILQGVFIVNAYTLDPGAVKSYTIQHITISVPVGGVCNVTFTINSVAITGLTGINVGSTPTDFTATGANIVPQGGVLGITVNTLSGAHDLTALIYVQ